MDKSQLTAYLLSIKRSKAAITRSLSALAAFEKWLAAERNITIDEDIQVEDLEAFIQSTKKGQKNLLLGLGNLFEFQGKEVLSTHAMQMRRDILNEERKPMRLQDFLGVDDSLIDGLKAKGIGDAW